MNGKLAIESGNYKTALIIQDFTQIEIESGFIRELIICKYTHDSETTDGLKKEYKYFLRDIGDKNTISCNVVVKKSLEARRAEDRE